MFKGRQVDSNAYLWPFPANVGAQFWYLASEQ